MKITKIKIGLSAVICLSVAGVIGVLYAYASGTSLFISPANLTVTAGNNINLSAVVGSSGSKVCAVEATVVFNNLSCQSITLADGLIPQSLPTCSSPHFLIGIPSCTMTDETLFTASVKAVKSGLASISFTGVDLIGEGSSLGSVSNGGNYVINSAPVVSQSPTSNGAQSQTSPLKSPKETQTLGIKVQSDNVSTQNSTIEKPNPFLATVSGLITFGTGLNIIGVIVLFAISLVIYLAPSYFSKKKR